MSTKRKRRQGTLDSFKRSKAFITPQQEPIKKKLRDHDSSTNFNHNRQTPELQPGY